MRFIIIVSILLLSLSKQTSGQVYKYAYSEVDKQGDTTYVINMAPVYIFKKPADMRKYARLVRNVKIVYPIAMDAKRKLNELEVELVSIEKKGAQRKHIKELEDELKDQYMPIIRKMSFSQGKILIKLIDRETDKTSYSLIKEFRGGFSAFCWQGIAKMFGANLKSDYDKDGDDKLVEQIILLYEAGLL